MPKSLNPKKICQACRLHFHGDELQDIAVLLDVAPTTLTRWKKTKIWKDFEAKLIDDLICFPLRRSVRPTRHNMTTNT